MPRNKYLLKIPNTYSVAPHHPSHEDLQRLGRSSRDAGCALNSHQELQRYMFLFIYGNYSCILSQLDRNTCLKVRRAFTVFQLMTIRKKNHHSCLIVKHHPLLYEDANMMGCTWLWPLAKGLAWSTT
jgi:hypothetical protein